MKCNKSEKVKVKVKKELLMKQKISLTHYNLLIGLRPHILVDKLLNFGLDFSIVGWILDFLTNRVKVNE